MANMNVCRKTLQKIKTTIKLGPHKGEEMYVMKVDHYSTVGAEKIVRYASETCGIPKASLRQAWGALGSVNAAPVRITCCDREGNEVKK